MAAYTYPRFQSDDHIRLLHLHGGVGDINCHLSEAKFDADKGCIATPSTGATDRLPASEEIIAYDALSWAWGRESWDNTINMYQDSVRYHFKVSQKLEEALKALRHTTHERKLWIDAICIDQKHNNEKSHQIPLMDKIYGHARQVCVWLGEKNEKTDMAFKFIRDDILTEMNFDVICQKPNVGNKLEALSDLMQRDWFSRRWVLQEIALAKTAAIYCGDQSMDWNEFAIAVELFVHAETKTRQATRVMMEVKFMPTWFDNVSALGAALLVRATSDLFRKSTQPNKRSGLLPLDHLVCRLASFQTAQTHDTIYSFLAVAKDAIPIARGTIQDRSKASVVGALFGNPKFKAKPFVVDYSQPYNAVCLDFVKFAISQSTDKLRALDILCRPWAHEDPEPRSLDLPTWVTTLETAPFEMTNSKRGLRLCRRNGNPFVGLPSQTHRTYSAAGDRAVEEDFLRFRSGSGNQNSLFVTGFVLSTIAAVEDNSTGNVPEFWLKMAGWNIPREGQPDDPPEEFWRTLVADRGPNGENPPVYYARACREALARSSNTRTIDTAAITNNPEEWNSVVAEFCRRVHDVVVNRKLIRTKTEGEQGGWLGLVSGRRAHHLPHDERNIRKGDLICILYGCSVPVVLRKREKTAEEIRQEEIDDAEATRKLYAKSAETITNAWQEWISNGRKRPETWTSPSHTTVDTSSGQGSTKRSLPQSNRRTKRQRLPTSAGQAQADSSHRDDNPESTNPIEDWTIDNVYQYKAKRKKRMIEKEAYYEFWGECYIHGMMDGDALEVKSSMTGAMKTQIFELR